MQPGPDGDLGRVAAAGVRTGQAFIGWSNNPEMFDGALFAFYVSVGINVGQGGIFDYQREGNHIIGFKQWPEYRGVSNINVRLFCQQAGMTLDETLSLAGRYASLFANNSDKDLRYGLDTRTADFIKEGYAIGESGVFGPSAKLFGEK